MERQEAVPGFRVPASLSIAAQGLELAFYPGGTERLEALLELVNEAEHTLRLAFYIYAPDRSGTRVRDALAEAARRGVEVTLMLDQFGTEAPESFFAPLVEAGGALLRFNPRWSVRYLIRNHMKLAIADGHRAMIGGFNVKDEYFEGDCGQGWTDLGVVVSGPEIAQLVPLYDRIAAWCRDEPGRFFALRRLVRDWEPEEGPVRWLIGGPTSTLSSWAKCVIRDIERASRLDMMLAYFSPLGGLVNRIAEVARRGAVRLVLAGKSDNRATVGAARALYGRLLKRGARIHEFTCGKLHSKLVVADDAVYLGSANFDMRSLYLNLEIMLRVEDSALADKMRELITEHVAGAIEVTPELHRKRRGILRRMRWTLCWFLVAVLDYRVTRRLNFGWFEQG